MRANYLSILAAILVLGVAPSNAAPRFSSIQSIFTRYPSTQRQPGVVSASWIDPDVKSAPDTTTYYVSFLTSLYTGSTNMYRLSGGQFKQVGQLAQGGGPVAIDSSGNVYVADAGGNSRHNLANAFPDRSIYVYAQGTTKPAKVLKTPLTVWNMAFGIDGTLYAEGPVAHTCTVTQFVNCPWRVVKFAPNSTQAVELPTFGHDGRATGLAVDDNANLYVGYFDNAITPVGKFREYHDNCYVIILGGCELTLPSGASTWKPYLPPGGAANDIGAGPLVRSDGSQIIVVENEIGLEYLLGFAHDSKSPSIVADLPVSQGINVGDLLASSNPHVLWGDDGGAPTIGSCIFANSCTIWTIGYPSGKIQSTYSFPHQAGYFPVFSLSQPLAIYGKQ